MLNVMIRNFNPNLPTMRDYDNKNKFENDMEL